MKHSRCHRDYDGVRASTIRSKWLAITMHSTASAASIATCLWLVGFLYRPKAPANR